MTNCITCQNYGFVEKIQKITGENTIPGGYDEIEVMKCPDCDVYIVDPMVKQFIIKSVQTEDLQKWGKSKNPELPKYKAIDVSFLPTAVSKAGFARQVINFFAV